jgi:hypothetical protein
VRTFESAEVSGEIAQRLVISESSFLDLCSSFDDCFDLDSVIDPRGVTAAFRKAFLRRRDIYSHLLTPVAAQAEAAFRTFM